MSKQQTIRDILESRTMVLDGAMATMIQKYNLKEENYRTGEFKHYKKPLNRMYDLLNLTEAQIISNIHRSYLESGADIITTNTFSANKYTLTKYGLQEHIYKINLRGAQLARTAADQFWTYNKPRFVAGCIGSANKSLSNIEENTVEYEDNLEEIKSNYYKQAKALIDGGVDILLLETFYDMENAKAAISAINKLRKDYNYDFAVMLSATIIKKGSSDNFGNIKEFYSSLNKNDVLSIGLNCSYGSTEIITFIESIAKETRFYISAHPNAGLPNKEGDYSETPDIMAASIKDLIDNNLVNIIGTCCGSTPEHTRAISEVVSNKRN